MFLVRCPKCLHDQKCQPMQGDITTKTKRCVYCGRSFKIHSNMKNSRIVSSNVDPRESALRYAQNYSRM